MKGINECEKIIYEQETHFSTNRQNKITYKKSKKKVRMKTYVIRA